MPEDEPLTDDLEDVEDELDDLTELVAAEGIIAGTERAEILERVNQCHANLETLREISQRTETQPPQAESPLLQRILEELSQIRAQVAELKERMERALTASQTHQQPPDSQTPNNPQPNGSENQGAPAIHPPPAPAPERRKRRFL